MKRNNGGFSLVEVVVAMAILGIFATASCTCLVLAHDMNGKTDGILQSRLAVSSAVETLMAEGITAESAEYDLIPVLDEDGNAVLNEDNTPKLEDRFPEVRVETVQYVDEDEKVLPYYNVTVTSKDESISITTQVRKAYVPAEAPTPDDGNSQTGGGE